MSPLDRPPAWVADAVFYQIFPDRFAVSPRVAKPFNLEPWHTPPTTHGYKGGDLLGIVEHLDWLTDLGVNALYLNPVFQAVANHRYHTHDYFQVDPILGGNDAFEELLDVCHRRGIRVVIDGVFNHASRGFLQFNDILENGPRSPWIDWFIVRDWPLHAYDETHHPNYDAWWGLAALPKFNTDHPQVREFLMRVGEHWARRGIDGWRLDVPQEIKTPGFWEEFRQRIKAINPDLYLVGEVWAEATEWIGDGTRFDGTMNYPLTAAIISFVAGDRVDPTTDIDNPWYVITEPLDAAEYANRVDHLLAAYPDHAHLANLNLLDSHDTARILSIASGDRDSVVLGALLLFTFPGAPCVYYGTEIGLPGGRDPDCRRSFPWEEQEQDRELLETFRSLVALRREHPALRSSDYRRVHPTGKRNGQLVAFERRDGDETLLVAVNAGEEDAGVPVGPGSFTLLWGEGKAGDGAIHLPARTGSVWRRES
jgi:cyclomaltodextrinase / maltogenic alpha-amylase / neopullulanase